MNNKELVAPHGSARLSPGDARRSINATPIERQSQHPSPPMSLSSMLAALVSKYFAQMPSSSHLSAFCKVYKKSIFRSEFVCGPISERMARFPLRRERRRHRRRRTYGMNRHESAVQSAADRGYMHNAP